MSETAEQIDAIMEQAGEALVQMQYLRCEKRCTEALALARQAEDYDRYARILMPLQEARRQRRQAALDAGVVVLSVKDGPVEAVLDRHREGCVLLIDPPFTAGDEQALRAAALEREQMVEVLRLTQAQLRSTFEREIEMLGDAALARVSPDLPAAEQVDALADVLSRVGDHEIAHQRLEAAARRASHERAARKA